MLDERQVLVMNHWRLHFGDYEPARSKEVRLYKKGWIGYTVSPLSPFELTAINNFLKSLPRDSVFIKIDPDFDTCSPDEWAESWKTKAASVWFQHKVDWERFVAMLNAIPPRKFFYMGAKKISKDIAERYADKNHLLIKRRHNDEWLLSVPDLGAADDVWLKMMLES